MKLAILDFGFVRHHKRFNLANYQVLLKMAELYIVDTGHNYNSLAQYLDVHLFDPGIADKEKKLNSFAARIKILDFMRINGKLFKKYKNIRFDAVLIMNYEILTFPFYWIFMPWDIPVYVFQHQQLDELSNGFKRMIFTLYKNRVTHLVLEELFAEFLKNQIKVKNIGVVHNISYVFGKSGVVSKDTFILGISSNNDEEIIQKIIEHQQKNHFLEKYKTKMYIRSHKHTYTDHYLKVNDKYLSDQEYDNLYSQATAVLSLVPKNFLNRLSGSVLDAISDGKPVISMPIPIHSYYQKQAPSMFKLFSNILDFEQILEESNWAINEVELKKLQSKYVPNAIEQQYRKVFRKYLDNGNKG